MGKITKGIVRILLTMLLTFLIGAVLIIAIGQNPIAAYAALLRGAFVGKMNLGTTLASLTPLLLTPVRSMSEWKAKYSSEVSPQPISAGNGRSFRRRC